MVKGLATSHNSAKLLAIPFCQGEVPTNPFVKGMCGPLLAIQKVPHSHIKSGVGVHTPAMGIPPGHNGKALNTPLATLLDHIPPVIKQDLDACPVQSLGLPLPATWFVPHQLLYTPSLRKSVSFCLSGPEYEHRKMSYPASSSFCKALLLAPDIISDFQGVVPIHCNSWPLGLPAVPFVKVLWCFFECEAFLLFHLFGRWLMV